MKAAWLVVIDNYGYIVIDKDGDMTRSGAIVKALNDYTQFFEDDIGGYVEGQPMSHAITSIELTVMNEELIGFRPNGEGWFPVNWENYALTALHKHGHDDGNADKYNEVTGISIVSVSDDS